MDISTLSFTELKKFIKDGIQEKYGKKRTQQSAGAQTTPQMPPPAPPPQTSRFDQNIGINIHLFDALSMNDQLAIVNQLVDLEQMRRFLKQDRGVFDTETMNENRIKMIVHYLRYDIESDIKIALGDQKIAEQTLRIVPRGEDLVRRADEWWKERMSIPGINIPPQGQTLPPAVPQAQYTQNPVNTPPKRVKAPRLPITYKFGPDNLDPKESFHRARDHKDWQNPLDQSPEKD